MSDQCGGGKEEEDDEEEEEEEEEEGEMEAAVFQQRQLDLPPFPS